MQTTPDFLFVLVCPAFRFIPFLNPLHPHLFVLILCSSELIKALKVAVLIFKTVSLICLHFVLYLFVLKKSMDKLMEIYAVIHLLLKSSRMAVESSSD